MVENNNELRPTGFDNYVGQEHVIKQLRQHVGAESKRKARGVSSTLDHVIFEGPAGLGKTSLAFVIAAELGSNLRVMQATSIEHLGQLMANIMILEEGDIFFIDEIHALKPNLEEALYSIMEDFRMDITPEEGDPINVNLPRFTLIGATTEIGKLKEPLQDRFGHRFTLKRYNTAELALIISRSAEILSCEVSGDAVEVIAGASRGTPRIANNLLKKARNYAEVKDSNDITLETVIESLGDAEISTNGMDYNDMRYLLALKAAGKPVGLKTLSGILAMDQKTIENNVESFLLENGYIDKQPRGRALSTKAIEFLEGK